MKTLTAIRRLLPVMLGILGLTAPNARATTLPTIGTDYGTYVVSGSHDNSNQGGLPYDVTNFYAKGAMMISAPADDVDNGVDYGMRAMEALFSFNTTAAVASLNSQYGAGNWHFTSASVELSSNYATAGTQANNPDFNLIAAGAFQLFLLGGNPDLTAQTWNTVQAYLPTTTQTSLGIFNWLATGNLENEYVTYSLNLTPTLSSALLSGELTFFGTAADTMVGYLFNTNTKGTPPGLILSADLNGPTTGPTLTLSTLVNGSFTNNATLNVAGSVSDPVGIQSVTVNGSLVTVNGDGSFSQAVTLVPGANSIVTVATDTAGLATNDTRSISLDQTAPVVSVTTPSDNSVTAQASLTVTGLVTDPLGVVVTIQVNGAPPVNAHQSGTGYDSTVTLAPGTNTIVVTATDQAGNVSSLKRSVLSDPNGPTLSVTTPSQDTSTTKGTFTVAGSVTDLATGTTVSITVGSQVYTPTVGSDGSFSQSVTLAADSIYGVIVIATDQVGKSSSVQRNILRVPLFTISDALESLRIAVGLDTPTPTQLADYAVGPLVNGEPAPDGVTAITIVDCLLILQNVVGLVSW